MIDLSQIEVGDTIKYKFAAGSELQHGETGKVIAIDESSSTKWSIFFLDNTDDFVWGMK